MPRQTKPPADPKTALARVRLAQERVRLAALAREEAEAQAKARRKANLDAERAKQDRLFAIERRIQAGGFGQNKTPAQAARREAISDSYADSMGWS